MNTTRTNFRCRVMLNSSTLFYLITVFLSLLLTGQIQAQCIQATSNTTSNIGLASTTNPGNAYDSDDGNTTTAATMTTSLVGIATLNVTFDRVANRGDSIIVMFGVPTANILDWGSLGGTTFTPYSGTNGTGTASSGVTAANLAFIIEVGISSLARIAIPVTAVAGARSLKIEYLGIGATLNKRTFIYDVAVKPGPVVTSANQTICSGGTATFTGQYNALASTPIDVIWYGPDGTTVLKTDANVTGAPYTSSFTTPALTTTTTYYVQERWNGCTTLSDPRPVTVTVRQPLTPDISVVCGSTVTLGTTTTGATGAVTYAWTASNGGNIVSGANSSNPVIDSPGSYQVVITDANGCQGTVLETFTGADCAALPVTLIDFKVQKTETTVRLNWSTSAEINSERFGIERSSNGRTWYEIGSVLSQVMNSKSVNEYFFDDPQPFSGQNLYRLKMIDRDATFSYSRIEGLTVDQVGGGVYPNPVSDVLFLREIVSENVKHLVITNVVGKQVYAAKSMQSTGIPVGNLPTGVYVINVTDKGNAIRTFKVMINR